MVRSGAHSWLSMPIVFIYVVWPQDVDGVDPYICNGRKRKIIHKFKDEILSNLNICN